MFRNIAATVAGIVIAFVVVLLVNELGGVFYPAPEGLDFTDATGLRPYLATLPLGAILLMIAAPVVAAFLGTIAGCYIGTANARLFGAIVGGIVLAKSIEESIALSYPLWLALATVSGTVASTVLAMYLAPPSGEAPPELFDDDGDSG